MNCEKCGAELTEKDIASGTCTCAVCFQAECERDERVLAAARQRAREMESKGWETEIRGGTFSSRYLHAERGDESQVIRFSDHLAPAGRGGMHENADGEYESHCEADESHVIE